MFWKDEDCLDNNKTQLPAFKVIITGNAGVGKTSLIKRYLEDCFIKDVNSTIGASFTTTKIAHSDGKIKKLNIWDTAGQERYRSIINIYYRDIDACIIVCDLNNNESIEEIELWINDMKEKSSNSNPYCVIIGNKVDLLDVVEVPENLKKIAEKYNYPVILSSAQNNTNIQEIFDQVSQNLKNPFSTKCMESLKVIYPEKKRNNFLRTLASWCGN